ncbi:endo alpha-1,4 polygalactosaminidase [Metabacillus sp. KIGAM252]|uniref:Endo alpha-1,4 polygalactosaminidase n=1 Tax=Metabacillus flavus TaxID=2823519 RepID=A0ABS5LBV4_9BACI|nr:endo alpha-1,4 polygalactosaminidase [Metabacillus flavus]MBS2968129.1 endo alpha-1,4 polygalactosaminidase [Metabacillus flavus]
MRKKSTLLLLCFSILLFFLLGYLLNILNKQKNPLDGVLQYKIYYGEPAKDAVNKLSGYPLVIIEPTYYSKKQIQQIKRNGTLVYGYINSMEADRWNEKLFKQFEKQDFHQRDGERVYLKEWDAYLMDMTSPHYRETLLKEINQQIEDKQLDGVFLDTIGDIDDFFSEDPKEMKQQQESLILLLKVLERRQLSVIQNWGMETAQKTAPYIDGFMWEDFQYSFIMNDDWSREWMEKTRRLSGEYGVKIFTVSEKEKKKSEQLAEKQGFIHYYAPRDYEEW